MCSLFSIAPHPLSLTSPAIRPASNQEIQFGLTEGGVLVEGLGVGNRHDLSRYLSIGLISFQALPFKEITYLFGGLLLQFSVVNKIDYLESCS